jgi:hypothetical protein
VTWAGSEGERQALLAGSSLTSFFLCPNPSHLWSRRSSTLTAGSWWPPCLCLLMRTPTL